MTGNKAIESRRGSIGCGSLILVILAVFLIYWGIQGLGVALTETKPTRLSYEDYIEKKPKAKWLHLEDGVWDIPSASYKTTGSLGHIEEAYVPLLSSGGFLRKYSDEPGIPLGMRALIEAAPRSVHVLVATKDRQILSLMRKANATEDKGALERLFQENKALMFQHRDAVGLVRFGADLQDSDRRDLAKAHGDLARDFVILEEGAEPKLGLSIAKIIGGLVLAAFMARGLFSKSKAVDSTPGKSLEKTQTTIARLQDEEFTPDDSRR